MPLPRVHRLVNTHGDTADLLDFGARIRALTLALPGGPRNVVLGYRRLEEYLADRYYIGATVGRYANRIGGARFSLDGREYRLSANEGANHLHGGREGFDKRFWKVVESNDASVTYRLESPDGDQGYPANVAAEARFELRDTRELAIRFGATADAATYVSLTQHAYFNLGGAAPGAPSTLLAHRVQVASSRFTPTDAELIPTGEIATVTGTDLDLRAAKRVGDLLASNDSCIRAARGADVNYVLEHGRPAAELVSGGGDLRVIVETSCPCLQLYTGQNLAAPFEPCAGLCLEPQYFPDAPNRPAFPSALLRPGERYEESLTFRFVVGE
jgi:aldose 1-epimerase